MQKSEYRSMVVIYIPTILYKYTVITNHDPILQEYYINMGYKIWFTRDLQGPKVVDALEQEGRILRKSNKEDGSGEPSDTFSNFCQVPILQLATLLLRTPISNKIFTNVQAPGSGSCRSRVIRMQLNEYIKAKWRAQASTHVQEYWWIMYSSKQAGSNSKCK